MSLTRPDFAPPPAPARLEAPTVRFPTHGQAIVVVDKPLGVTSQRVVGQLRRLLGIRKVGHAGTLDPAASGVLIIGIGRATRVLTYLVGADKTYCARMRFGLATNTDDAQGRVLDAPGAALADISARLPRVMGEFIGHIEQRPCTVSAIKVGGVRAYTAARAGKSLKLAARPVSIHGLRCRRCVAGSVTVGAQDAPGAALVWADNSRARSGEASQVPVVEVDVTVDCSSGTYVRALARDMGARLGCGGHLSALRRTRSGPFSLDDAVDMATLAAGLGAVPHESPLLHSAAWAARRLFATLVAGPDEVRALSVGASCRLDGIESVDPGASLGVLDNTGRLVAIAKSDRGRARPEAVFVTGEVR